MSEFQDLTGQRFGRFLVLRREGYDKHRIITWLVRCDCGTERIVDRRRLAAGNTRSCGCLRREMVGALNRKHGLKGTPEYVIWVGLRARCANTKSISHANYGGRGIKVCERWDKFENFLSDMGVRPSPLHSIDRIDNDGNYEPGNCRWATRVEQNSNTRRNRIVTYRGQEMTITEAACLAGSIVTGNHARNRIVLGWAVEAAVETPLMPRGGHWSLRSQRGAQASRRTL